MPCCFPNIHAYIPMEECTKALFLYTLTNTCYRCLFVNNISPTMSDIVVLMVVSPLMMRCGWAPFYVLLGHLSVIFENYSSAQLSIRFFCCDSYGSSCLGHPPHTGRVCARFTFIPWGLFVVPFAALLCRDFLVRCVQFTDFAAVCALGSYPKNLLPGSLSDFPCVFF